MRRLLAVAAATIVLGAGCTFESATGRPAAPSPSPAVTGFALERIAKIDRAVSVRSVPGDDAVYVVVKSGTLWRIDGTKRELILDITDETTIGAEGGLLDFVVSPDGRYAYIHFSGTEEPSGDNHIREYEWTGTTVAGEPREVLVVEHPYNHHYSGQLQFGPDGYLYIAIGDGGLPEGPKTQKGDPHGYGQRTDDLLGNVLRIDPRPGPDGEYSIPADNPFVGRAGRDEIWAYGLRNPWRFSFDRETGDLWLPDVGQYNQEEINLERAGSTGGRNYGWNRLEGWRSYLGEIPSDAVPPVYFYPHRGACAIIGGHVYRGSALPDLRGWYVYGDFCNDDLQAIRLQDGIVAHRFLGTGVEQLTALAEDVDGELMVASFDGVYRLVRGR